MIETKQTTYADPDKLSFYLLKKVNKALRLYQMIEEGDRIAVAVSGGKDSLTLLHLLQQDKGKIPAAHDLVAVHVESEGRHAAGLGHDTLEGIFREQEIEYAFENLPVVRERAEGAAADCFRCSWNRRQALFQAARRLKCNKIAIGHHADDVAETALLNLFYHGRLETMKPKVELFGGSMTIIRPLYFVPEKEIVRFAEASSFPIEASPCPYSRTSKRARMKELLRAVQRECPKVKSNLLHAVEGWRGGGSGRSMRQSVS